MLSVWSCLLARMQFVRVVCVCGCVCVLFVTHCSSLKLSTRIVRFLILNRFPCSIVWVFRAQFLHACYL